MRTAWIFAAMTAAAFGAIAAPAALASAQPGSAVLTIAQLEAQGFDVKVNRLGSGPLEECTVTDIGNARNETQLRRVGDDLVPVVVNRRITVSVDCTR